MSIDDKAIAVSAPGKILLLGGYAVLERPNVAYVLAVNKYVTATLEPWEEQEIAIDLPDFGFSIYGDAHQFSGTVEEREKAKFVVHAIRAALTYLEYKKIRWKGFKLTTKSDPAFQLNEGKSGLGSSAAVTVATVAAVVKYHALGDIEIIHKLAQFSHAYSQGKVGSGFDVAAACYGSIQYVRYSPFSFDAARDAPSLGRLLESEWDYQIKKMQPPSFPIAMASLPGTSASTGEMVKKINAWKTDHPDEYAKQLQEIDAADRAAIASLEANDTGSLAVHWEKARRATKELGKKSGAEIESDEMTTLIEESLHHGALVCKLPGAGGSDSMVALTRSEEDRGRLQAFWAKKGLHILNAKATAEGLRYVS